MKKVSAIVPVYKVEKYIANTVRSVLAQTYQNLEIIIVDDGSPDRSVEICQQFNDARIKIIRQPNQGVSAARNTGIRHAEGEYLAFLDGDDLWVPEKLQKHVAHLENSPNVGISFSRSAFIDESGNPLNLYQMPKLKDITPDLILCRNPIGNGSSPVIRRQVFQAIEFTDNTSGQEKHCYFDEKLHHFEDVECWLRIALQTNWQIEGIPDALTLYRVTLQGASANVSKQVEDLEKVIEKTRSYAPELVAKSANRARAYEFRFLARRMVSTRNGKTAIEFVHRALATYWRIILEEPRRTFLTLAAAYSLSILPSSFYKQLEDMALKITGANQKRRILQEQTR